MAKIKKPWEHYAELIYALDPIFQITVNSTVAVRFCNKGITPHKERAYRGAIIP